MLLHFLSDGCMHQAKMLHSDYVLGKGKHSSQRLPTSLTPAAGREMLRRSSSRHRHGGAKTDNLGCNGTMKDMCACR